MNPVFGIHVGTTSACLAICKVKKDHSDFHVEVVVNADGARVMPAIVTIKDNETIVGATCKTLIASNAKNTVMYNKMMVNTNEPYDLGDEENQAAVVMIDNKLHYYLTLKRRLVTPKDIYTCIYKCLHVAAKNAVPGVKGMISCALMVPKHFTEATRMTIKTSAEAAHWNVLHIGNEPSTVILGYDLLSGNVPPTQQGVLVYRAGGHSCDATVINLESGMITLLDTEYSKAVGGKVVISVLTNYLADDFNRRYKLDLQKNHRSLTKLTLAAEKFLCLLSSEENSTFFVESLCEGVDFEHVMSRARFESLLHPFLPMFAEPLHTVLARLKLTPDSVSMLLLCGGLLKIPRLRKFITDIFKDSCVNIVSLPKGLNYDEILACGAARQAGCVALSSLQKDGDVASGHKLADSFLPSEMHIPVLNFPLTIWVEGADSKNIELMSGHPLPFQSTMVLTSCAKLVTINAIQIESDKMNLRGQLEFKDLEDTTHLKLEIDAVNGINVEITEGPQAAKHQKIRLFPSTEKYVSL